MEIFLMELSNMGLVVLYNGFDYFGLIKLLFGGSSIMSIELYKGFENRWYSNIGQAICFSVFSMSFSKNLIDVSFYVKDAFKRFHDRGFKFYKKKDPNDDDDDSVNTRKKTMEDLINLYTGKEFEGEKNYGRMISTMFVILLYSTGMPILYAVGAFFFFITLFINKILLLKYYRRSTRLNTKIAERAVMMMKYAILLHILVGFAMLTNPMPFQT